MKRMSSSACASLVADLAEVRREQRALAASSSSWLIEKFARSKNAVAHARVLPVDDAQLLAVVEEVRVQEVVVARDGRRRPSASPRSAPRPRAPTRTRSGTRPAAIERRLPVASTTRNESKVPGSADRVERPQRSRDALEHRPARASARAAGISPSTKRVTSQPSGSTKRDDLRADPERGGSLASPRARPCGRCRAGSCPSPRRAARTSSPSTSTFRLWFVMPPPSTSNRAPRPGQTRSTSAANVTRGSARRAGRRAAPSAITPGDPLAEDLDLDLRADVVLGGQVRVRDRLLDRVAVPAARHAADELAVRRARAPSRARRRAGRRASGSGAARSGSPARGERLSADELALVELHGEPETGLERRVLGRDVRAPDAVALLEPQRVDRLVAARDEIVLAARPPRACPRARGRTRSGSRAPSRARRRTSRAARGTARGPIASSRACMYGNDSFERSVVVSGWRSSRALGPQTP